MIDRKTEIERRERSRRLAFIGTLLAIILVVGFISFPFLSGLVAPLVPDSVEDAVGAEMIKDTASEGDFCIAPEGMAALESIARRLATHADGQRFKIYVSHQDVVNAFAAPGGHVVIYAPIIAQADGPDEVAGVLAHEMGHVVERHPTQGLVEAVGYGIFGALNPGGKKTREVAKALLTNQFSRADELEADAVGVTMLNAAGMDSRGLISFFTRLKESGEDVPGAVAFLSTHPSGETRREHIEGDAKRGEPALDEETWTALRAICDQTGPPEPIVIGE